MMKNLKNRIARLIESDAIKNREEKEKLEHLLKTKRFNPYCLRHSSITNDSDYLPEYALKKKCRWSMNSRQGNRYIKNRMGNDLKQKILTYNGIAPPEEMKMKASVLHCPRCELVNALENKYCSKCSYPLVPSAFEEIKLEEEKKIHVPDIDQPVQKVQAPNKLRNLIKRIVTSNGKRLQYVEELFLEEENTNLFLGIQRTDGSKYSAILKGGHPSSYVASKNESKQISFILEKLGEKLLEFAEIYMKDDRKEVEFLHDIVALGKDTSKLSSNANHLISIGAASDLMHNRIVAQLLATYKDMGCTFNEKPTADVKGGSVHDFNIDGLKCDVKTIQSIGELEHVITGGLRLTSKSNNSLINTITDDIEKAIVQVGSKGMIFIAPWSYRINGLLRSYFKDRLLLYPPPPSAGLTILILTSERAFEDYYVSFESVSVITEFRQILESIQLTGVTNVAVIPIRRGLTMNFGTAARPGSSAGYVFKI
jgi:hypothetical protein